MVCLRNICINTLHKGDNDDDDDNNNNNIDNDVNNYNYFLSLFIGPLLISHFRHKGYFCTRLRSVTHTNSAGLPWTRDQPVGKGPYLHKTQNSQKTSNPPSWKMRIRIPAPSIVRPR